MSDFYRSIYQEITVLVTLYTVYANVCIFTAMNKDVTLVRIHLFCYDGETGTKNDWLNLQKSLHEPIKLQSHVEFTETGWVFRSRFNLTLLEGRPN